ncbi:hypothetical protein Peur_003779 [Populus x canadensis]
MKKRDAISWTVMILGFSLHGKGELGVELSRGMEKDQRAEIDQLTCVAVLHCCTTACMVDQEGKFYFKSRRPASDVSLHDEDEERECIQIGHSEMLALSFALISTQPGAAIRFSKILRVLRMS